MVSPPSSPLPTSTCIRNLSTVRLSGVDALLYPNVDWYDEILRSSAPSQRYNASVRGGTKRMRYYASLEYYDQESLFKNLSNDPYGNSSSLNYKRYGFRANADFFLTKDLQALRQLRHTLRGASRSQLRRERQLQQRLLSGSTTLQAGYSR